MLLARWGFEPIFDSYLTAGILALALLLLLAFARPQTGTPLSTRRRVLLLLVRAFVIFLLWTAMMRPAYVTTREQPLTASLLVLLDQSRSMQVKDAANGQSRFQALLQTLAQAEPELKQLQADYEVKLYAFAESLRRIEAVPDSGELVRPTGEQSDLATALSESARAEAGKRMAAVVVLSDGAHRVLSPGYDVQQAAKDISRRGTPIYTVTYGLPRDKTTARDVAIENFQEELTAFVQNEIQLRGAVRVQGYVNQPIEVRLTIVLPDGSEEVLGPLELVAAEDDSLVDFQFPYTPQSPGDYRLIVKAAEQSGELITDNNAAVAYLKALDGGLRILVLETQLLRPEQLVLRRSLASSPEIDVDFQPIDLRRRDNWPVDLANTIALQDYDIFLIGDVDSSALSEPFLTAMSGQVNNGKGLMLIGGRNAFGAGGYESTPLADLIPVEMDRLERQPLDPQTPIRRDVHLLGPLQMIPLRDHFITQLASGDANLSTWRDLPPLNGVNRFREVKPRATVLATSSDGDPLLVAWAYGSGRVLAFAGDSTHRWWLTGNQAEHQRFWRQAMLWLGNKDQLARKDVWVQLNQRRFSAGQQVVVRAGAKDESGNAIQPLTVSATVVYPSGREQTVAMSTSVDQADVEEGVFDDLSETGEYVVTVRARSESTSIGSQSTRFSVTDMDLELTDPAANPSLMQQIADATQDDGGRALPPEQLAEAFRQIHQKQQTETMKIETKWELGDTTFDAWIFFLLFVGTITTEWWLRRRWGLA